MGAGAAEGPVPTAVFERMVSMRRDLHRHPELSWQEARTAELVGAELSRLGIAWRGGIAGHGIVADLPGPVDVPAVALRADMDALPIQEETGLPFASQVPGVMHACGHDGHTAMLLGAAAMLVEAGPLPAPVRLIFQPAEERGAGAEKMIEEGVLDDVGLIFGGHVDRHYPAGTLVVTEGAVNASTDGFTITISGQGAHGARPHESIDAVVVGSLLVMSLQTIVSREVDPASPSVVTVGSFHAGTVGNAIAGKAVLEGTIRAQHDEVRVHLCRSIERIATAIAALHEASVGVCFHPGSPAVINDPLGTGLAWDAAVATVGVDNVGPLRTTNMGGEDFACFLEQVPGCYVRFGAQVQGRESFPAHSSQFDFDELALGSGAAWLVEVARRGAAWLARREQVTDPEPGT